MIKKLFSFFLFLPLFTFAIDIKNFKKFEYYKESEKVSKTGVYYVEIDSDIENHSKKFLNDIRIYEDRKKEILYFKKQDKDYYLENVKKIDLDFEKIGEQEYFVDLNNKTKKEYINAIVLKTKSRDFKTTVEVFGSETKDGDFVNINLDDTKGDDVYSSISGSDLEIKFKYSNYNFLKLKFSGYSDDFKVDGFYKETHETFLREGEKKDLKVFGVNKFVDENYQVILLDTKKDKNYFDSLKLNFADKTFERRKYILYGANKKNAIFLKNGEKYDSKKEYWLKIDEGELEKLEDIDENLVKINNDKRYYRLEIDNGEFRNLDFDYGVFERYKIKIYFIGKTGKKYYVYYGALKIDKPKYKIDFTELDIKNAKKIKLGKEKKVKFYLNKINEKVKDNWLTYFIIGFILILSVFFSFKIFRETKNKTAKDEIKI